MILLDPMHVNPGLTSRFPQTSIQERNQEVRRMGEIYRHAGHVIVRLGREIEPCWKLRHTHDGFLIGSKNDCIR